MLNRSMYLTGSRRISTALCRKNVRGGRMTKFERSDGSERIGGHGRIMMSRYSVIKRRMTESAQDGAKLPSAEETMAAIGDTAQRVVDEQYVTGLVVALVADGQVSYRSFGSFNKGLFPTSDEESKGLSFEIGSITKPLTGVTLASLVNDGKLAYSTTLREALPGLKSDAMAAPITMAQLATHSSGLPRLPSDLIRVGPANDPYSKYSKNDVVANLGVLDSLNEPGKEYEYSNLGFGALGLAMINRSGKSSYDQMMKERVFDALNMETTSTTLRLNTTGHNESLDAVQPWHFQGLEACGALRSTPSEMVALLKAIADPSTCSELEKAITASISPVVTEPHPMGLGWVIGLEGNQDIVWHNGSTAGYHNFIGVHRPTKRGVLLMSNTANSIVSTLGSHFLSTLIGKPTQMEFHEFFSEEIPTELVAEFAGLYRYKNSYHFYVKTKGSSVYVKLPKQSHFTRAFPETPFRYHIRSTGAIIEFEGLDWDTGRPPHTLVYKHENSSFEATRDGQEARKFLKKIGSWFSRK